MESPGPTPDSSADRAYIPAATDLPELTSKARLQGIVMAVVLRAARRASTRGE